MSRDISFVISDQIGGFVDPCLWIALFLGIEHCIDVTCVLMYCVVVIRSAFILEEHCDAIFQNVIHNTSNLIGISGFPLWLNSEMQISFIVLSTLMWDVLTLTYASFIWWWLSDLFAFRRSFALWLNWLIQDSSLYIRSNFKSVALISVIQLVNTCLEVENNTISPKCVKISLSR
jgi:hypothetical protein